MSDIDPAQLQIVATFLTTSRDHLGLAQAIHLHWPRRSSVARPAEATVKDGTAAIAEFGRRAPLPAPSASA